MVITKKKRNFAGMRAVIQRVTKASVLVMGCDKVAAYETCKDDDKRAEKDGNELTTKAKKRSIGLGFLVLLGVCDEDTREDVDWLVRKIAGLRVFNDDNGVMNRSILDVGGEVLVVSQFTLYASYKKGNRPSWYRAGSHEHSIPLYEAFCKELGNQLGKTVGTGEFGADMKVELLNDGPVTICMDTKNKE